MTKQELRAAAKSLAAALSPSEKALASDAICDKILALDAYRAAGSVFAFSRLAGEPDLTRVITNAAASGKKVFLPVFIPGSRSILFRDVTAAAASGAYVKAVALFENKSYPAAAECGFERGSFSIMEPSDSFPEAVFATDEAVFVADEAVFATDEAVFAADEAVFAKDAANNPIEASVVTAPALLLCPRLAFDKNGARLRRGAGCYDRFLSSHRSHFSAVAGVCFERQIFDEIPADPHDERCDFTVFA
jgi:5-formyltetrahydrofolate cyclo-ligase